MKELSFQSRLAAGCLIAASFFSNRSKADESVTPTEKPRAVPTAPSDQQTIQLSNETLPRTIEPFRLENKKELSAFLDKLQTTTATHAEIEIFDDQKQVIKKLEVPLSEDPKANEGLLWLGIAACLVGSACLSGMNVGLMSLNRLELEIKAEQGDKDARKILALREDSNTVLATILWSNVGVNCLLTLLSDSAFNPVAGFAFSVGGVTLLGEILPQGYFSRNALSLGAKLAPAIQALKYALYPLSKPSGMILDMWLGKEGVKFWEERHLEAALRYHLRYPNPEIGPVEAQGAANFLKVDDINVCEQGTEIKQNSIIKVTDKHGDFALPSFMESSDDPFIRRVNEAEVPWVVLTDGENIPRYILDADAFLRHCLIRKAPTKIEDFCHTPLVVNNPNETLGMAIKRLEISPERADEGIIDNDVILFWNKDHQKILTGADILAQLLDGVVTTHNASVVK